MQWQDISTAPKDGTSVDLWVESGNRITNCWYSRHQEVWVNTGGYLFHQKPTHWIPLPNPPKQGE